VIQLLFQRLKCGLDFTEVLDPTRVGTYCPFNMDLNTIRVSVKTAALVTVWDMREAMSRFKGELAVDLC
jgi:hypothetical protein